MCLLAATYEEVLAAAKSYVAAMSPGEREEIFGGTALRGTPSTTSQSGGGQSGGAQ